MRLPIRIRLTAWYVALLAVILSALSAFLIVRLKSDLVAGIDVSLASRAAQIAPAAETSTETDFKDVSDASLPPELRGLETGAQVLSSIGRVLQSSGDPAAETPMIAPGVVDRALTAGRVVQTVNLGPDREPFRVLAIADANRRSVLVVTQSMEDVNRSVHQLAVLLLVAGPLALSLAALGGWWLARKALRPVAQMTDAASGIGMDRLDERISVPGTSDELERLARTLNSMLERLERGVEDKRRFVADASHELRTPLAVMRSELDVAIRSNRMSPEARTVLESATEEVDRMTRIVENLLTLVRFDAGRLQLLRSRVDLREIAETVAADLRRLAVTEGIRIRVSGREAVVTADRDRLRQAATNLVENAVKYSDRGGEVEISVWERDGEAGLSVSDDGPGIPSDALARIFERFFRADPARSRGPGGSGLGLAICLEIVQAHGGRAWAESDVGSGSRFFLALPASADARRSLSDVSSAPDRFSP